MFVIPTIMSIFLLLTVIVNTGLPSDLWTNLDFLTYYEFFLLFFLFFKRLIHKKYLCALLEKVFYFLPGKYVRGMYFNHVFFSNCEKCSYIYLFLTMNYGNWLLTYDKIIYKIFVLLIFTNCITFMIILMKYLSNISLTTGTPWNKSNWMQVKVA